MIYCGHNHSTDCEELKFGCCGVMVTVVSEYTEINLGIRSQSNGIDKGM